MKNELDKRIDEALDESSYLEEEWWMKYAKFPTEESDGQSIPLCLVPDFIAEAERRERERIDQKIRTDISTALATAEKAPMGASQWCEHGKKYGYDVYFAGRMRDTISRVVYENVFGDARPSLSCQPYELVEKIMEALDFKQDLDPKHPRCPKCGELMKKESEYTWMCECFPDLRLSIG